MIQPRCDQCHFWKVNYGNQERLHPDDRCGTCHRYAPTASANELAEIGRLIGQIAWATEVSAHVEHSDVDYAFEGGGRVTYWPPTTGDDWCGDFVKKSTQPEGEPQA